MRSYTRSYKYRTKELQILLGATDTMRSYRYCEELHKELQIPHKERQIP